MPHPEAEPAEAMEVSEETVTELPAEQPDYINLVRLLLEPLVSVPESLKVDCETCAGGQKILVRVAVEEGDRGRVFGRGGRNVDAVRTLLKVSALTAARTAHLEVHGSSPAGGGRERRGGGHGRRPPRRNSGDRS